MDTKENWCLKIGAFILHNQTWEKYVKDLVSNPCKGATLSQRVS